MKVKRSIDDPGTDSLHRGQPIEIAYTWATVLSIALVIALVSAVLVVAVLGMLWEAGAF